MVVTVETLEKLERRITLTLPVEAIEREVQSRLKRLARTAKADGFRPGKIPMSFVSQRYGYSVQYEVMNDQVGRAFDQAVTEAHLRVAGRPRVTERDSSEQGMINFEAVFEVYPEVTMGNFEEVEVERISTEVTDESIDRTIEILRKQRRTFDSRSSSEGAEEGDRATIDFEGKIDGVPFEGGKAESYQFLIGEGQMLEAFETAVRGMKEGESKTFPLVFPSDYQSEELAGKEADFLVTVKKIERQHLPEVDEVFAKPFGITDGSVEGLRADIRRNLEREVKARVLTRNKAAVMEAVTKVAELELPTSLVSREIEQLTEAARASLKNRGIKEAETLPISAEIFQQQAEQRVRLGLAVSELVKHNDLGAKPEQLQAYIEELSQSYEKPAEVIQWYLGDRQRMMEVQGLVVENNVTNFVFSRAKVIDKQVSFDELMSG